MIDGLEHRTRTGRGIVCMIAGAGLLTISDGFVKWLTDGYPVTKIIAVRGAFILLPMFILAWRMGKFSSLCSAPGSLDTSLSHAAGLIEIAACHA